MVRGGGRVCGGVCVCVGGASERTNVEMKTIYMKAE